MDKKSKIFFLVFFLLIAGSAAATYYRYVVAHDYIIQAQADCDPYTEACFVHVCDPEADGECTNDPVQDTSYYKLINRNAKNIPLCDPNDESCAALTCPEDEAECSYTLCDTATAEKAGDTCNDPVVYTQENPVEEEGDGTVEEGDGSEEVVPEDGTATDGTENSTTDEGSDATEAPVTPETAAPAN